MFVRVCDLFVASFRDASSTFMILVSIVLVAIPRTLKRSSIVRACLVAVYRLSCIAPSHREGLL